MTEKFFPFQVTVWDNCTDASVNRGMVRNGYLSKLWDEVRNQKYPKVFPGALFAEVTGPTTVTLIPCEMNGYGNIWGRPGGTLGDEILREEVTVNPVKIKDLIRDRAYELAEIELIRREAEDRNRKLRSIALDIIDNNARIKEGQK